MQGIFIVEFYNETDTLPECRLCFNSIINILDFVEENIRDITPEYKGYAAAFEKEKPIHEKQALTEDQRIVVSFVPFVESSRTRYFNKYITDSRQPTELLPSKSLALVEPGTINYITKDELKDNNVLIDFQDSIKRKDYVKNTTLKKWKHEKGYMLWPFTNKLIDRAYTRKVKIVPGLPAEK